MTLSRRHFLRNSTVSASLVPVLMGLDMDYCEAAGGADIDLSMGFPQGAVRLNWNENTLGPSPLAVEGAMAGMKEGFRYALGGLLTPLLADYHDLDKDWFLMGTGSTELQRLAPATWLQKGDGVVSSVETWAGGLRVAGHVGANITLVNLRRDDNYHYDVQGLLDAINADTRMLIVVTPNNPTGTVMEFADMRRLADALPKQALFVIDEAYAEYLPDGTRTGLDLIRAGYNNVLVTRTFSKVHAMAGLRSGYGVAHPDVLETITHFGCGPASTSIVAFGAIQGALADREHAKRSRSYVRNCRAYYEKEFSRLGLHYVSGPPPFMMVELGDRAAPVHAELKKRKILVGNGKSWKVPEFLRISYGREEENRAFFKALAEIL